MKRVNQEIAAHKKVLRKRELEARQKFHLHHTVGRPRTTGVDGILSSDEEAEPEEPIDYIARNANNAGEYAVENDRKLYK